MIIAHFFLREIRKQPYLFVETTSSQGIEQPSPAAQLLVKVSYTERRQTWVKKAYYEFVKKFPQLTLVDAMENTLRLESDHPSFDLVFRPIVQPKSMREKLLNTEDTAADAMTMGHGQDQTEDVSETAASEKPVMAVIKNLFNKK